MHELKLKSKIINAYDYCSVDISKFAIPLEPDLKRYERDLLNFCKVFAEKEEVSNVAEQDIVTLSCSSDNPKFQKKHLTVRIGLGLYSKELEAKIIGMTMGETKSLTVGNDLVNVCIEKIVREIIPELTDELAVKSGIPDIQTAEDARTYCRYKQYDELLEEPADEAFAYLAQYVLNRSEFELDEEELTEANAIMLRGMNDHRLFQGKTFDEVTEEEFYEAFGFSKQTMLDNMKKTGEGTLKTAVLGQRLVTLYDKDYEEYLEKRATAMQRPMEEIRRENTEKEFIISTYSEFCMDTLEKYVFKKLKEVGEWKHRFAQNS